MTIDKIIEGYNQEKIILISKIASDDVIENFNYETRVAFVAYCTNRIKEIDQLLESYQKMLFRPITFETKNKDNQ